jgi:hypothetical protein
MRMKTDPDKTLTNQEKVAIDKALRLLRDRHYNNYYRSSNPNGEIAQKQYQIYQALDQLRGKVLEL